MSIFGIFFTSVPQPFWSEYSGKPFFRCIDCEVPLIEASAYVVQKRIVGGEAVFEMALCEGCRGKMAFDCSEETKARINSFMGEHFRNRAVEGVPDDEGPQVIEVRRIEDEAQGQELLRRCMDYCLICDRERSECHRYSLAGLCRDDEIVAQISPVSRTPLMICDKCESGMGDLISKQTRDSWDKFVSEHFDGPPGVEVDSPSSFPLPL